MLHSVHELTEVYTVSLHRIMKEIIFKKLMVFYKNKNGQMECVKGVSLNIYLLLNSQEIINEGYIWSEECESLLAEITSHLSWLFARDLCTRSHQSSGAKSCKQSIDSNDRAMNNVKATNFNSFPSSVIKTKNII